MWPFKKSKEDIPPDVGEEDKEEMNELEVSTGTEDVPEPDADKNVRVQSPQQVQQKSGAGTLNATEASNIMFERLMARIEALSSWIKNFQEKFSNVDERIGELRSSTLKNEKEITQATLESTRAAELVREVQPEKLRVDYQKLNTKYLTAEEKIIANIEYSNTIMEELKALKRKAELFVGTESVLKLNDEVKRDLLEIQKLASKVKMHADKSEQFFIELRALLAENQKLDEKVSILESQHPNLKNELQKLRLDYANFIGRKEFDSFNKTINHKLSRFDGVFEGITEVIKENERLAKIIETTLAVSEKNRREIEDLAATIGDDRIERIAKFEEQIDSILGVIDSLVVEVKVIKRKLNMPSTKKPLTNYEDLESEGFEPSIIEREESEEASSSDEDNLSEINKLLKKANSSLKSRNTEDAEDCYNEIDGLYRDLSVENKKTIYPKIKNLYEKLSKK